MLVFISFQSVALLLAIAIVMINANRLGRFSKKIKQVEQSNNRPKAVSDELLLSDIPEQFPLDNDQDLKLHDVETRLNRRSIGFRLPVDEQEPHLEFFHQGFVNAYHRGRGVRMSGAQLKEFVGHSIIDEIRAEPVNPFEDETKDD